jgi:enoyl-CoA hydratase/carnithine racemase
VTTDEHVIVERHGPVGWLINNRPDADNAMNRAMQDAIADAWRELGTDPSVRVIVHTAAGRNFSAGGDNDDDTDGESNPAALRQPSVWKPVIAAVNGICSGSGLRWIAHADIVIAGADAEFFDPHVTLGRLSIEAIALIKKMPAEAVMRMALVGAHERIDARRALEIGMISEIVDPAEHLRERAQSLAEAVARNSPAAMAATKKALWGAIELGLTDACKAGAGHLVSLWGHPDQAEGPEAFAERREPQWAEPSNDSGADR